MSNRDNKLGIKLSATFGNDSWFDCSACLLFHFEKKDGMDLFTFLERRKLNECSFSIEHLATFFFLHTVTSEVEQIILLRPKE